MAIRLFSFLSLILLYSDCPVEGSSKPVSAVLHSYWPQTSIVIEARQVSHDYPLHIYCGLFFAHSEFIHQYDELAFWRFVEATLDLDKTNLTDNGTNIAASVEPTILPSCACSFDNCCSSNLRHGGDTQFCFSNSVIV